MRQPVAIIGTGQTNHTSRRNDVNQCELVFEACSKALERRPAIFSEF